MRLSTAFCKLEKCRLSYNASFSKLFVIVRSGNILCGCLYATNKEIDQSGKKLVSAKMVHCGLFRKIDQSGKKKGVLVSYNTRTQVKVVKKNKTTDKARPRFERSF